MKFKLIVPESDWIESDLPFGEALQEYQFKYDLGIKYRHEYDGKLQLIKFVLAIDELGNKLVSRLYHHGIWRKGNPALSNYLSLSEIAKKLEWDSDPNELLANDWVNEETIEQANVRECRVHFGPEIARV